MIISLRFTVLLTGDRRRMKTKQFFKRLVTVRLKFVSKWHGKRASSTRKHWSVSQVDKPLIHLLIEEWTIFYACWSASCACLCPCLYFVFVHVCIHALIVQASAQMNVCGLTKQSYKYYFLYFLKTSVSIYSIFYSKCWKLRIKRSVR